MDETKIWVYGLVTALALIVGGIGSCSCVQNYQDNTAMIAIVQAGHDPISAKCAVKQSNSDCSIIAARGVK